MGLDWHIEADGTLILPRAGGRVAGRRGQFHAWLGGDHVGCFQRICDAVRAVEAALSLKAP